MRYGTDQCSRFIRAKGLRALKIGLKANACGIKIAYMELR